MFIEIHTPQQLGGQELDRYLERGWFRRGPAIFTTHFVQLNNQMLSIVWLRVKLLEYEPDRVHKRLFKENARFTTKIGPASITEEKEALYARYKVTRPFVPIETLSLLMFGKDKIESVYNTYEVSIRDNDKLIACCYFDLGEKSVQAVVLFFDPDYKNFSLGKYLIYNKIQYCKDNGYQYFYPGYYIPNNTPFQYKIDIGRQALQYFELNTGTWHDHYLFTSDNLPAGVIRANLEKLHELLTAAGIESHILKYEFFDIGLYPYLRKAQIFDYPIFLLIGPANSEPAENIIVFDIHKNAFCLLSCKSFEKCSHVNPDSSFYCSHIVKPIKEIFVTSDVRAMSAMIAEK